MSWGIKPSAMIGHSVGEYVAGCLAGVFTLESEEVGKGLFVAKVGRAWDPQELVGPAGQGPDEGGEALAAGQLGQVGHPPMRKARVSKLVVGEALEQLLERHVQRPGDGLDGQPPRTQAGGQPVRLEAALHEPDHRYRDGALRVELGRADAEPLAREVLLRPQAAQAVGKVLGLVRARNVTP